MNMNFLQKNQHILALLRHFYSYRSFILFELHFARKQPLRAISQHSGHLGSRDLFNQAGVFPAVLKKKKKAQPEPCFSFNN